MLTFRNTAGLVLAAAMVFSLSGCQSAEQEIGVGELVGRTYTHEYFDLKITVPAKWSILTREQMEEARKAGRRLRGGFGGGKSRRGVMLICMSRLPMDKPLRRGQFNHNLIIAAERVGSLSGVDTGEEYLNRVGKHLNKGKIKATLGPIEHNRKIGHFDMDARGISLQIGEHTVRQRHYAVKVGNYFLFVVATFKTGPQFRELQQLIAAIR